MDDILDEDFGTGSLSLNFIDTTDSDAALLQGATQVFLFYFYFLFPFVKCRKFN